MSTLPGSPRILKGGLVTLETSGAPRSVITFQYNPETISRSLQTKSVGGDYGEPMRLYGPPSETISFDAEIDANDQIMDGNPVAAELGIHPALAALELLLYPPAAESLSNEIQLLRGKSIVPGEMPLTLLVWGPQRVLPVRIDGFSITEEAFDAALNPIRAKVQMSLRVLSYLDLGLLSPGGAMFMAHQVRKEILGRLFGQVNSGGQSVLFTGIPGLNGKSTPF